MNRSSHASLYLSLFALLIIEVSVQGAVTISVIANEDTGRFLLPDGGTITPGATYDYGLLDLDSFNALTPADQRSYPTLTDPDFGAFDVLGTFAFDANGAVQVAGAPLSGGTTGQVLHALIHDSTAGAIGLFTSSHALWQYPADPGSATLSNSLPMITLLGEGPLRLTSIPEPSGLTGLAGLLLLAVVGLRRRHPDLPGRVD